MVRLRTDVRDFMVHLSQAPEKPMFYQFHAIFASRRILSKQWRNVVIQRRNVANRRFDENSSAIAWFRYFTYPPVSL